MKSAKKDSDQSARFREAAKKAEGGDAAAFERVFKKVVKPTKADKKPRLSK
jgi:hypothetical protein